MLVQSTQSRIIVQRREIEDEHQQKDALSRKGSPSSTPAVKESVVSRQPCPNHGSAPAPQAACVPPPPKQSLPRLPIFSSTTLYTHTDYHVKAWSWPRGWWWRLWMMMMMIRTPLHLCLFPSAAWFSLGIRKLHPDPPKQVYSVYTSVCLYGVHMYSVQYVFISCIRIGLYTHTPYRRYLHYAAPGSTD